MKKQVNCFKDNQLAFFVTVLAKYLLSLEQKFVYNGKLKEFREQKEKAC